MRFEIGSIISFVSSPKTRIESCNLRKDDRLSVHMREERALEIQNGRVLGGMNFDRL
jgi:hypothetical protein